MMEKPFMYIVSNEWRNNPTSGYIDTKCGWGNGYVAVPQGHPFYGVHFKNAIFEIEEHFGLTYSELNGKYWVLGFDTGHVGDTLKIWPMERVIEETRKLLAYIIQRGEEIRLCMPHTESIDITLSLQMGLSRARRCRFTFDNTKEAKKFISQLRDNFDSVFADQQTVTATINVVADGMHQPLLSGLLGDPEINMPFDDLD